MALQSKFKRRVFALSFLLSIGCVSKSGYATLPVHEFIYFKTFTDQLLERYSLDRHTIISVGRSPTPIAAMLDARFGSDTAKHLPLSKFNHKKLDPHQAEALHSFFDQFLTDDILSAEKDLVLLDLVLHGDSLWAAGREVRAYLASRRIEKTVHLVGFAKRHRFNFPPALTSDPLFYFMATTDAMHKRFANELYDRLAAYEPFVLQHKKYTAQRQNSSANYKHLVARMQRWLEGYENNGKRLHDRLRGICDHLFDIYYSL